MSLGMWVDVSQILLLVFTAIGVIISIYIGSNTIKEQKEQRRLAVQPRVLAKKGGGIINVEIKTKKAKKPKKIENLDDYFKEFSVKTLSFGFGEVCNFGLGCAFEIECTWKANTVVIDNKTINITEDLLNRGPFNIYYDVSNVATVEDGYLLPKESTKICNLPTFITDDVFQKIELVEGTLKVSYQDIYGGEHYSEQGFIFTTFYKGSDSVKEPHIILSIGKKHTEEDINHILWQFKNVIKKKKK